MASARLAVLLRAAGARRGSRAGAAALAERPPALRGGPGRPAGPGAPARACAASAGGPPAPPLGAGGLQDPPDDGGRRRPRKRRPWERGSMQGPGDLVDEASRQDYIQHEVARFVPMLPHPLSMQDFLDMLEPARLAKFLHEEVLVRSAERIRWIQDVEGWEEIEELRAVRAQHLDGFRALRLVRRVPTLDAFSEVVRSMMDSLQDVPQDLTRAMRRLNLLRGDKYGSDFTDKWLDDFFLSYIGTQMLMAQYLACWEAQCSSTGAGTHRRSTGIIDPDCEPARVCSDAATEIQAICKSLTGRRPVYTLEVHSAAGDDRGGSPRFSFVPGFLKVIVMEILKNSFRATAEIVKSTAELSQRPTSIIVCADDKHVAIRISDRAGGIPFDIGSRAWSYSYSTTGIDPDAEGEATELAGYGVGLPLSRLYARYLGGTLDLVSLPGYGTSVDIFLRRVSAEQVEVVPDSDKQPERA